MSVREIRPVVWGLTSGWLTAYSYSIVWDTNKAEEERLATSAALRQINQARILSTLRRGSWSRVALAEELGLNRSTVTVIVSALLAQGLVHELDPAPHAGKPNGRPRVGVALRGSGAYFGGLEIGNEQLTAVVCDLTGREIARAAEPTVPELGPEHAEQRLAELLSALLVSHLEGQRLEGIGLTVPGLVTTAGQLEWAPTLGWRDSVLGELIRARFAVPVQVENDANAAALAEEQLRGSSEGDNLLYLLLDSGIGAALLVHRELYRGGAGRFGEAGHIRLLGSDGSSGATVEKLLGRQAVLGSFQASVAPMTPGPSWEDLLAALDAGDPTAEQLRDQWQSTLGWLTAALAWTIDPDVIVFGGPASALLQSGTIALHRSLRENGPSGAANTWRLTRLDPHSVGAVALSLRAYFAIPPLMPTARSGRSLEVAS